MMIKKVRKAKLSGPAIIMTENGPAQRTEEATVHVNDLDTVVDDPLLDSVRRKGKSVFVIRRASSSPKMSGWEEGAAETKMREVRRPLPLPLPLPKKCQSWACTPKPRNPKLKATTYLLCGYPWKRG